MKYNLKDFSIEEKLKLLTGKDNWRLNDLGGKLPEVFLADGPHGLRKNTDNTDANPVRATAMPNISVLANSWNKDAAYLDGSTIADECIENDVAVLLAPGVNIKRTPLNGRNFEYFSEDPYLAGTMAEAYINGVQSKGVGTSVKHYCANNREYDRYFRANEIDERTLREIYLKPFQIALKAKPMTVMCAYNLVNGIWASEHKKLLKDILRDDFGFEGLVMSDWGAVHNHVNGIKAGLDLRMPYDANDYDELKAAYDKGELTEEEIDFCVSNILNFIEKTQNNKKTEVEYGKAERHKNAVEIAKEGIVLLKNEDGILPLDKSRSVAVAGVYADKPVLGGGGSAYVQTDFVQPKLADLIAEKLGVEVEKCTAMNFFPFGLILTGGYIVRNVREDYDKIYNSDVAIICVGEQPQVMREGCDRPNMKLSPEQEEFIINAAKLNENVVVLVYGGSAIDMSAWVDSVKAVMFVGFAGEGVNEAVSSILVGETNPSGKLSETFPISLEDTFTEDDFGDKNVDWYNDGIFVGYRYYDKAGVDVLYPFGHGLSYSQFEYSDLEIKKLGKYDYEVSYNVTNVSDVDGKEISQIYVKEVLPLVIRPEKELKGFSKDLIKAGETKRITVKLDFDSFAHYGTGHDKWVADAGTYEISVGASSRDIKLKAKAIIE